jgi:Leu/Phe-tRNA-protein transferase
VRRRDFEIRIDTAFSETSSTVAQRRRVRASAGTWITPEMMDAYCELT